MFKGVDESVIFVFLPLNRQELADLLGVHRTALSRSIARLVACGEIVHPGHSRFVIRGIV